MPFVKVRVIHIRVATGTILNYDYLQSDRAYESLRHRAVLKKLFVVLEIIALLVLSGVIETTD